MQSRVLLSLPAAIALLGLLLRPEPPLTLDSVLARWQHASRECRSLDVEVTRIRYSAIDGFRRSDETGRLYFEAPDRGRLEIRSEYVFVWNDGYVLYLAPRYGQRHLFTPAEIEVIRKYRSHALQANRPPATFWEGFTLAILISVALHPADAIPFVLLDDRAALESQFDITLGRLPSGPLLTMKPRTERWRHRCTQIEVILDPTTYRTFAVRETLNHDQVVYLLDKPRVNELPAGRDRLLDLGVTEPK